MIGAIVLAAGMSRRMGRPKPALPWGDTSIVGHIARVLMEGGAEEIVVVTGGAREAVEAALSNGGAVEQGAGESGRLGIGDSPVVRAVFNPDFERGEMLSSLQAGLRALSEGCEAALIALGDQPQIQGEVMQAVIGEYRRSGSGVVAPSYKMQRGHPVLLARPTWPELLALSPPATLRDFLKMPDRPIHYVVVNTPSILADVDTPEEYRHALDDR